MGEGAVRIMGILVKGMKIKGIKIVVKLRLWISIFMYSPSKSAYTVNSPNQDN
jgi:hypothetical protein